MKPELRELVDRILPHFEYDEIEKSNVVYKNLG